MVHAALPKDTVIPAANRECEAENNPVELSQREAAAITWKEITVIGNKLPGLFCGRGSAGEKRQWERWVWPAAQVVGNSLCVVLLTFWGCVRQGVLPAVLGGVPRHVVNFLFSSRETISGLEEGGVGCVYHIRCEVWAPERARNDVPLPSSVLGRGSRKIYCSDLGDKQDFGLKCHVCLYWQAPPVSLRSTLEAFPPGSAGSDCV